jgi:UDP-glucuronate decarboxylase
MLELAKKNNAKFLLASTSEVYGDPIVHPQKEDYHGNVNPIGPRSCYVEGKRISETLCFDFKRIFNIDIKVIRIFNTYGPGMSIKDGRLVSNFIVSGLKKIPLVINGDGSQTRSFCYVDDLIKGMLLMMDSDYSGPINIGNPIEYTVNQLAERILFKLNLNNQIIYKSLPEDDPKRRKPDIVLAKKYLNWEPEIMLSDGLDKTINYFRKFHFNKP